MSIELVMPSNHLILHCPLLLLPSVFSSIRDFSNESDLHIRWPNYWSFSFSISPSFGYSWLLSFRLTGLISLQSKGPPRVFPSTTIQKHQILSLFYGPTLTSVHGYRKNHSLDYIQILVAKVMSLLFNTLSRFVIALLPRSKHLLILWLQSQSAVILEPKKIKLVIAFTLSPSVCPEVMGLDVLIFVF